jgi:hypothetical protein
MLQVCARDFRAAVRIARLSVRHFVLTAVRERQTPLRLSWCKILRVTNLYQR